LGGMDDIFTNGIFMLDSEQLFFYIDYR